MSAYFDLPAALRERFPNARPGVDYVLEKPADAPLRLASWNAMTLGPLPQDLLDEHARVAALLLAKERREAAFQAALPLDDVLNALLDAVEAPKGSALERIKAIRAKLNEEHPSPDEAPADTAQRAAE